MVPSYPQQTTTSAKILNTKAKSMAFKGREKTRLKNKGDCAAGDVINLDTTSHQPLSPAVPLPRPSHLNCSLLPSDLNILLNGKWLNDVIINEGQRLIKQEYPHVQGFQDVALGHTMAFSIEPGEFVQVLYAVGHWVTISTIGCGPAEVDIYDSGSRVLNNKLQQQIAALLCTKHDIITVR